MNTYPNHQMSSPSELGDPGPGISPAATAMGPCTCPRVCPGCSSWPARSSVSSAPTGLLPGRVASWSPALLIKTTRLRECDLTTTSAENDRLRLHSES